MTEELPAALVARVRAEVAAADRRARVAANLYAGRVWNKGVPTGTPDWCRRNRAVLFAELAAGRVWEARRR